VPATRCATVRGRGIIQCPPPPQQDREPERAVGISTLVGPAVRRLGLGQRPLLFEQSAEVRGGDAMATLVRATVRGLRLDHAPLVFKQPTEVESASAVAELIGVTVCRLGLGQRPLLFEQSTEVRGGDAMATLVGVTIGRMRFNHAPFGHELLTEVESASGFGGLGGMIRSSPRPLGVCAIAIASRSSSGAMPVGSGGSMLAVRRCVGCPLQDRRSPVATRPFWEGALALPARRRMPKRSDEQARNEYQCERER
jgi:hypothetical protein